MRVEFVDVRKRFGKIEVLRGVTLELGQGERVALVGPNGSGKSTLLRALLGLVDCTGDVRLDGQSPYDHRERLVRRIAYVPQIAPALSATVGEIVELAVMTRGIDASDVAAIASRLELDLERVRKKAFRALSGGMKQKVLVALAFATRASLLVMDEPTASLDVGAQRRFRDLVTALPPETSLILCSHRFEEYRDLVLRVVGLEEGRVAFDEAAPVACAHWRTA